MPRRSGWAHRRAGLATLALAACGSSSQPPDHGELAGRELARGIAAMTAAAKDIAEPYHCASLAGSTPEVSLKLDTPTASLEVSGRAAALHPADPGPVRAAFLADARGARPQTTQRLRELGNRLAAEKVHLIVSLGGMATERDDLLELLGALAEARIPIVAIPGDRESIPDHRAAIAQLVSAGAPILDGSVVRVVSAGDIVIATFPGVERAEQLIAGADGCQHTAEDAAALSRDLASRTTALKVWAGYAPAQQRAADASDLGLSGVHIGELSLAEPVAASGAALMIHAMTDDAVFGPEAGETALGTLTSLATGPVEALSIQRPRRPPVSGSVVVAALGPSRVRWRRIVFEP